MSGTFNARGELDPDVGVIVFCAGKKRSGKSKMALLLFEEYPYDRVVIDFNGTDGPHVGVIELRGTVDELPAKWPEELREDGKRMTLRYHPDAGSPTYLEDVDAVLGMAYRTGRVCILIHEVGLIAKSGSTPPHLLRILQSNRHRNLTLLQCAPRVLTTNTLSYGQADLVYVFELPNKYDRETLADSVGWDRGDFAAGVSALDAHEYLRCDTNENRPAAGEADRRVLHFPPLPADVVAQLDRL